MANKSFGTKQLDLTGASGSPIITSPSDLSINATTVAISTNVSVGGYFGSNVNVGTGYSIGIGTTIPVAELEVRGDIGLSGSIVSIGNTFTVKTSNSERFRIAPNGYVGIGTDNPTELVDIQSYDGSELRLYTKSSVSSASLSIRGGDSGNSRIKLGDTADDNIGEIRYVHSNDNMLFFTDANERLRIDSDGKVGIGITNPSQQLHLYHATANEVARFESGDATSSITFKDSATTSNRATIGGKTDDFFVQTGGSETFRIDSSGNVICQNANAYFAPPRITTNAMNNLTDMPGGAMVFNTNEHQIYYYNNNTSTWLALYNP